MYSAMDFCGKKTGVVIALSLLCAFVPGCISGSLNVLLFMLFVQSVLTAVLTDKKMFFFQEAVMAAALAVFIIVFVDGAFLGLKAEQVLGIACVLAARWGCAGIARFYSLREEQDSRKIRDAEDTVRTLEEQRQTPIHDAPGCPETMPGRMEIIPSKYKIEEFLNDILNTVAVSVREKELGMFLEIDKKLPREFYGDDVKLRQVLMNLLANAVKYTESGKITLRIQGEPVGEFREKLHFEVRDTGIGIKEEDIPGLFTAFQRLESNKTGKIPGMGLGLFITHHILGCMGSSLEVDSIQGIGSIFSFSLEQDVVDEMPIGDFKRQDYGHISGRGERVGDYARMQEEELPVVDGVDWNFAMLHFPSQKMLLHTVHDFYKMILYEADTLEGFWKQIEAGEPPGTGGQSGVKEQMHQFQVQVHGMKSAAALVGIIPLSGCAKILEDAAKRNDSGLVRQVTPFFLAEWRGFRGRLSTLFCESEEGAGKKEDDSELLALLGMLQGAADGMDIDTMDEIAGQLLQFRPPEGEEDIPEKISLAVTNLDVDLIDELTGQWMNKVRDGA